MRVWTLSGLAAVLAGPAAPAGLPGLDPGFTVATVAGGFEAPVGIAIAGDGRIFVAEQRGIVWVVQDGQTLEQPFIDIVAEVNGEWDRGLLGIALDPGFLQNRRVYLLYTVDPVFGEPDESPFAGAFGRLTRYTGTLASNGNLADLSTRQVLIGATAAQGIPVCEPSHTIGSLRFGTDGSLFVSAGDGAHFDTVDPGGLDGDCFGPGMFPEVQNIGAFRAQYLGSLAGKILRIDPGTGLGLADNPHWTGNGADAASRVWASGVRNPFRIGVRPGSPAPGTIYVGDVGWYTFEEVSVAHGGENFGWPCVEGPDPAPGYPGADPAHSGCGTIETPGNPGPLTGPVAAWHHGNPAASVPPGYTGNTAVSGAFYAGACYPAPWQGAYFFADYAQGWIRAIEVDAQDNLVAMHHFADGADFPVDIAAHPATGDLHYVAIYAGEVRRISYDAQVFADLDGDCRVGVVDFLALLGSWGPCPGCPADLDGDGAVGILDFLALLASWT
jgi:glucose/arabinose dehydrogenase